MIKKYSIRIVILALIFAMLMPITVAFAVESDYPSMQRPMQHVYVHDNANILNQSEESRLTNLAMKYVNAFELNVLFLTIDDADGKSTVRYTDDYMDDFFPVGVEDNIAFVIDMDNREFYINTMGIAIERLTDEDIEKALDKAEPSMKREHYAKAFEKMADFCLDLIVNGESARFGEDFVYNMLHIGAIIAAIITAIVVIVLVVEHNVANKALSATKYVAKEDYKVIDKSETMVRIYDTVQKNYYKPKTSSGGRSGGSSHRSSSGRSHGGGGRRF